MGFFGTGGSINVLAHAQDLHKPLVLGTCIHLAPLKIFLTLEVASVRLSKHFHYYYA